MNNDLSSLSHTKWRCQYHIVFAPGQTHENLFIPEIDLEKFFLK